MLGDRFRPRQRVRALLDPCAESTFISLRLVSHLGQATRRASLSVTGFMGESIDPYSICGLWSPQSEHTHPPDHLGARVQSLFKDINLADINFTTPQGIDLVLGADIYPRLMLPGLVRRGQFIAQHTVFGWVVTGARENQEIEFTVSAHTTALRPTSAPWHEVLAATLRRFWTVEEVPKASRESPADAACEALFTTRCGRDSDGRYVVTLPVIEGSLSSLGESLSNARNCLSSLHGRMERDPSLKTEYIRFMEEYHTLGHMRRLRREETSDPSSLANYLPHHGIWQRKDGGKKLRVVFNASCPTSSGLSLNDVLYSGPKLQNDLLTVMTRWRRWAIAFCTDIKMMFRQIRIHREDANLQRILWSSAPSEPEEHYALCTVTYGETCAPYLALRTLQQHSRDEGSAFPAAVRAIERELYVDDFLCGADSEEDAFIQRDQLVQLLKVGGFTLKKWVCNTQRLLDGIPTEDRLRPSWLQLTSDGPVNELGIMWDPTADCITFAPPALETRASITKRQVLAEIARLFDPAGWLSPVVLLAKIFMQDLWRQQLDWDTSLPESLAQRWKTYRANLCDVASIRLPRWLRWTPSSIVQLHAFADASRRAIAAVVYLRARVGQDRSYLTIVCAKTKLAPAKVLNRADRPTDRVTIPRLELRAALLAARLLRFASKSLDIPAQQCHAWSDSNIVLHWLRSERSLDNDFVDNFVSQVQEIMPDISWRYVCSADNPADIATRGASPAQLNLSQLWWSGPAWLADSEPTWPKQPRGTQVAISALRPAACSLSQRSFTDIVDRFSSLDRLLRVLARCRRLFRRHRAAQGPTAGECITAEEMNHEFFISVRRRQRYCYPDEIKSLENGQPVHARSPLRTLLPFLDDLEVLRVGGRLDHSPLSFSQRHPAILDRRSHLAQLVIDWAHTRALRGGFRVTYAYTMQRAWIVGGRSAVKAFLRRCVVCARYNQRPSSQVMAPLPAARVTPSRPFSRSEVDYAGPFHVLSSKGRGTKSSKGYVALFVCLCTKAVHLELVGDLSTASFLGALSRFSGRRGKPAELWSDNATNFRGADMELRRMLRESEFSWTGIANSLSAEGIKWRFIPASAPHFGGLWEAGVKSMKGHLRRIAGPRRLTYEEFATLLVEIEMVLNSRPLGPYSDSIDDLDILTPAHFLIGGPLTAHPHPSDENVDVDHATHWRLITGLCDHFWRRWSREYLNTLQQRWKWTRPREGIMIGDLVMIIDPSLLKGQGRWPLGRVTSVHPGTDERARVVQIKTADAEYTRPITKLVRMPVTAAMPPHSHRGRPVHDVRSGNEAGGDVQFSTMAALRSSCAKLFPRKLLPDDAFPAYRFLPPIPVYCNRGSPPGAPSQAGPIQHAFASLAPALNEETSRLPARRSFSSRPYTARVRQSRASPQRGDIEAPRPALLLKPALYSARSPVSRQPSTRRHRGSPPGAPSQAGTIQRAFASLAPAINEETSRLPARRSFSSRPYTARVRQSRASPQRGDIEAPRPALLLTPALHPKPTDSTPLPTAGE